MNKNLLVLPLAVVLLAGCAGASEAKAEDVVPVKTQLQNLINDYIGDSGLYTKKTTICFTEEAMLESSKYFHADQVAPKRTTYYDTKNQRLLMAEPDGALDVSYGGYMFSEGKVSRFHTLEDSTLDNMYTNIAVDFVQGEYASLKAAYATLETFAADDYFADFAYEDTFGTYYYDLQDGYAEDCQAYKDFLGFAAPMLKPTSKEYLHAKSLVIDELRDANDTPYLSMKIYLALEDEGKSTGECGTGALCEARIYKGHSIFAEDLSVGYFLKGTVGGKSLSEKMTLDPDNEKQYFVKGLALAKNDLITVYSTDGQWHQTYEHRWANPIPLGGDFGTDYKVMYADSYDIYFKTDENKSWITAADKEMFYFKPSSGWKNDGAKFAAWLFDGGDAADKWVMLTDCGDGLFSVELESYKKLIFVRCDPSKDPLVDGWKAKWNQSGDIDPNKYAHNCLENTDWDNWTESSNVTRSFVA